MVNTHPIRMVNRNPVMYGSYGQVLPAVGVSAAVLGMVAIGPLVVMPFIVKAFKPKMPYGQRVGIGLAVSMGLALAYTLIGAASK